MSDPDLEGYNTAIAESLRKKIGELIGENARLKVANDYLRAELAEMREALGPFADAHSEARDGYAKRYEPLVTWGEPGVRAKHRRTVESNWRKPLQWNKRARAENRPMRVFRVSVGSSVGALRSL